MFRLKIFIFLIFISISLVSEGQLYINEFVASNSGITLDPDFNESSDWIEIYNAGSQAIQLKGYYVTDNISVPNKWQINVNAEIGAGKFMVIWADGKDTALHTNFKLTAAGEELGIFSPTLFVLDTLVFGNQELNISYGRKTNGGNEWVYFTAPTPGTTNNSSVSYSEVVKSDPSFSLPGGIYTSAISVQLTTIFDGEVRYTLDGAEPNELSMLAADPIGITKNTVVRARIIKAGQLPGPVNTNSYFIDTINAMGTLPVVSISTDPMNFWDPIKGLYVQSFKPDWEIPVNIELFENDGRVGSAFNLRAGIKVNGLYSWQLPEKMLGVYFRKEYGASTLDYPLIFDKSRKSFNTFALRASGSDWANTMFRDGMIQNSTMGYTGLDNSGFRACVVYVNGQYMGIHNIREKIDEDFIVGNHGIDPSTFDMVENQNFAETGDLTAYNVLLGLVANDLSIPANYDAVAAQMDIENFTQLIVTEVYDGNSSIGHNVMAWKPTDSGKWKWVICDLDRGFFGAGNQMISFYLAQDPWPFKQLMNNADYKKYFGRKLADHLFTTFSQSRIDSLIEWHKQTIAAEMPNHIERWKGTSSSYGNPISSMNYWYSEVDKMKTFARARPSVLLNDLTKYGFLGAVPVSIATFPANAGNITFNGLKIPFSFSSGAYPSGETIKLVAEPKAGFNFIGWKSNTKNPIIAKESEWKYNDTDPNLDLTWITSAFSDVFWKTGVAEFGYGDNDEATVVGFGGNTNNRYITTYFRKSVVLTNKETLKNITILLKCDDGAVVYVNGSEVFRQNMPAAIISKNTLALSSIAGADESTFTSHSVSSSAFVNGQNIIAVEVHQNAANSADVSFDLELFSLGTPEDIYLTTSKELSANLVSEFNVLAVYERDGKCMLPSEISTVMTLSKDCSPWVVPENVIITRTGKMIIEPGVELWMSDGVSISLMGEINAIGTASEPIIFKSNPQSVNKKWGNISINDVSDTCHFRYVHIEGASKGLNPAYDIFALTVFQSNIILDYLFIDNVYYNPLALYNSNTVLTNSRLHTEYNGADMLNVKFGKILIDHCEFPGNDKLDVDAIDFGEMTTGNTVVKNSCFHDFDGFNSDAVDLGDHAKNVIIDSIIVFNIQDKGVSIGQRSSAKITNSIFINCGMGAGMKDSSNVAIDHCTYYGNIYAIANYQKHPGDAGANAVITNSIISNSYEAGYFSDAYSSINISNSSDDTEKLPDANNNLFVNPLFTNPTLSDFTLSARSPLIDAGTFGNIGAGINVPNIIPSVMISDIVYYTQSGTEDIEFIGLFNPGNAAVIMDSCQFTKGITFLFPQGISIGSKEMLYITSNSSSTYWSNRGVSAYQWTTGRLSDQGEAIQLVNKYGKVIDQVVFANIAPWPVPTNSQQAITLKSANVDNHFGENWMLIDLDKVVKVKNVDSINPMEVYPNPTHGLVKVSFPNNSVSDVLIYSVQGTLLGRYSLNKLNYTEIDLSVYNQSVVILRIGDQIRKVIVLK